ncbi:NUDIX domain-containing protein [Natrialbaceae archaeon A-CW3]
MSITDDSEREVDALVSRLEADYGSFDRIEKTWTHLPDEQKRILERYERDKLGGAGVWLRNTAGEILLVRNEGDDGWADPGGKVDPGESVERAAKREVREEAGVDCRLTGVCEVHTITNRCETNALPDVLEAIVIFDGEYVSGEPQPREGEIADVDWFRNPPSSVLYEEVRTRPYPAQE